ncbi:MAG: chromate transporter [Bacillota bacterium]|nr:chromate transporter [Bacillota bacterium]
MQAGERAGKAPLSRYGEKQDKGKAFLPPTPLRLFWSFFTIGAFTFGGGYAMLPLIRKSIVERSGWMEDEEFVDAIAVAQSSPGPIAVNIAALTGYKLSGLSGALLSVAGAALPSFITILVVASIFLGVQHNPYVRAAMAGMRPAVVALMAAAVFDVGKTAIKSRFGGALALLALLALIGFNVHPVFVIIAAATAGVAACRLEVVKAENGAAQEEKKNKETR